MLDVSSSTVWLFGQNAGSPMTHNAPVTAPARLPSPPITAIATSVERVGDGEEPFGVADRDDEPAEQRAAEAGDEAAERERGELGAGRRDGERGDGRLVLAHADDRAADAGAAQVARDGEHDDEARRARSSSSCG